MAFSFGAPATTSAPGFALQSASAPALAQPASLCSFGAQSQSIFGSMPTGGQSNLLGNITKPSSFGAAPNPTFATTPIASQTASTTGFNFGASAVTQPVGSQLTTATKPGTGFSFGAPPTIPAATSSFGGGGGFAFSTTSASAQPASSFSFGTQNETPGMTLAASKPAGFSFAAPSIATANVGTASTGLSFATPSTVTTNVGIASTGLSFGASSTVTTNVGIASTGLSFGASSTATTNVVTASTGFSFGAPKAAVSSSSLSVATTGSSLFNFAAATSAASLNTVTTTLNTVPSTITSTPVASPQVPFSFGAPAPSTTLAQPAVTSTSILGSMLGQSAAKSKAPTLSFGSTAPLTTQSTPVSTSLLSFGSKAPVPATTSITVTTPSTAVTANMDYKQLEDMLNKWTVALEEHERLFINQATQVNAWDRLLIDNGERIVCLHEEVERVKIDQEKLDTELDYINSQQRELETCLVSLESVLSTVQHGQGQTHHADVEREGLYHKTEHIDAQLKLISQDLKEAIDKLNASSGDIPSDPICQITKIMNAHMDTLSWIDQNTTMLMQKVDTVGRQAEHVTGFYN